MMKNLNITTGACWHGAWQSAMIEPNRKLYDYELVFFSEGECRVICEEQSFSCRKGFVIIIPPGKEHCTIADTECYRWCIHFDWYGDCRAYLEKRKFFIYPDADNRFESEYAARDFSEISFPVCFEISEEESAGLLILFRNFFAAGPDSLGGRLQQKGIFEQILGQVLESSDAKIQKKQGNIVFFKGKSLLDMRFADADIEIRKIAAELGITPNHFNKLFRKYLGTTPSLYLQNRRLLHSEFLLENTTKSVKEIAHLCGFADANYFIRCFRKKNNITPARFR